MKKFLLSLLISLATQACVFDDDAFADNVWFIVDDEYVNFTSIDLELRTGDFFVKLQEPKPMDKWCIGEDCAQTLFTHKGHYFDFSFIADGDWTGDLSQLSKEEIDLLLHTQVREVNATVYFYQDFENTNPLLFTIRPSWPDFISGSSGNGIEAGYGSNCGCVRINLDINEHIAYDVNGNGLAADLSGGLIMRFTL